MVSAEAIPPGSWVAVVLTAQAINTTRLYIISISQPSVTGLISCLMLQGDRAGHLSSDIATAARFLLNAWNDV